MVDEIWQDIPDNSNDEVWQDVPEPNAGYLDLPASIAKKAYGTIANTVGGGISALEDVGKYLAVGDSPAANFLAKIGGLDSYGAGDNITDYAKQTLDQANKDYNFEPGSVPYYADKVGTNLAAAAPIIASGVVGGPVLPLIAAQSFANNYGNAQSEGQSSLDSAYRGIGNAAIDTSLGALQFRRVFKPELSGARKVAESVFANTVTSPFQTIGNNRVNAATGGQKLTYDQLDIPGNMIADAITGGFIPLAANAVQSRVKAPVEVQSNVDDIKSRMDTLDSPPPPEPPAGSSPDLLPVPVNPQADIPTAPLLAGGNFPKIIDYVQNLDSGAQDGLLNSLKLQRQAQDANRMENIDALSTNKKTTLPGEDVAATEAINKAVEVGRQQSADAAIKEAKQRYQESLPTIPEPKAKTIDGTDKLIGNGTFPKVMEYVQKNIPDRGAQDGFVNAIKLQREAQASGVKPEPVSKPDPKSLIADKVDSILSTDPELEGIANMKQINSMLRDYAITKTNPHLIGLAKDIPNFKEGANENGVIPEDQINSDIYDHSTAPVLVLRRLNGDLHVITGRHRLDLAKRLNEPGINTQILNEADGVTPDMAMALDAQMNIRDGKGTVRDYVRFFRQSGLTEGEAKAGGLLSGNKGPQGFAIGIKGTPELDSAYNNDKLSDAKAAAIATAAPNDSGTQRTGIRLAKEHPEYTAKGIEQALQRYAAKKFDAIGGDQTKMFPDDDRAMQIMDEEARVVSEITNDINETIRSSKGAAKLPEKASKMLGVPIKETAAVLKRLDELAALKMKWEKVDAFPEIRAELDRRVDENLANKKEVAKKIVKARGKRNSEKGSIINPWLELQRLGQKLGITLKDESKAIVDNLNDKEIQNTIMNFGKNLDTTIRSIRKSDIEKTLSKSINDFVIHPETVAKAEPKFSPFIETARRGVEKTMSVAHDLLERGKPFIQADSSGRMWEFAAAAREKGESFLWTADNFKRIGATDTEIEGLMSLRDTLDAALPIYRDTLIAQGKSPEEADLIATRMKKVNYVPFSRYGDKFIRLKDPETDKTVYFAKFPDDVSKNAALVKIQAEMAATGRKLNIDEGDFAENPDSLFAKNSSSDFEQHMQKSFNVPGYEKNMKRAVSEYISSLAHHAAKAEMKAGFDAAFKNLPQNSPALAKYAQDYAQYQLSNEGEGSTIRQVMTGMFLAGRVSSAALNLTQQLTTTFPKAVAEVGTAKATQYWTNAQKLIMERVRNPEAFAKKNPELNGAIEEAIRRGSVTERSFRELTGRARSETGEVSGFDKVMEKTMWFFDAAEKWNRYHSFVTAYQIARSRGVSPADSVKFSEQFTYDTQFDYSKVNRPKFARGSIGAPLSTFQLYKYNDARFVKNLFVAAGGGDAKAAQAIAARVAMGIAVGGLAGALPGVKELLKIVETQNEDPREAIRRGLGDKQFLKDFLDNGLMYAVRFADTSGVAGEYIPLPNEFTKDSLPLALGKIVGGVLVALGQKVLEAGGMAYQGDYGNALETIAPSGASGIMRAYDAASSGEVRNSRNQLMYKDPTAAEVGKMTLGFTPPRSRDFYNESRSAQLFYNKAIDNDGINKKIADAMVLGKGDPVKIEREHIIKQKILPEYEKSFPNKQAIDKLIKQLEDPIGAIKARMPKQARPEAERRFPTR